jgi:ABC-type sugar transport system ATPase subunit
MLGRAARPVHADGAGRARTRRLAVKNLACDGRPPLGPASFELASGEIFGLAGVEGSGAGTLLRALFGDARGVRGELELDGEPYVPTTPAAAFARGIALLASDRQESVLPTRSVLENATLSSLARFSPGTFLRPERERAAVTPEGEKVRLKAPSLDVPCSALSGGNQQKVALLRCLLARPRLLLLDDPTRGIDLGARADVHELLRELAREGTTVLFRSSDLGELVELAERALVLFDGKPSATLDRTELTEARLLALTMGAVP